MWDWCLGIHQSVHFCLVGSLLILRGKKNLTSLLDFFSWIDGSAVQPFPVFVYTLYSKFISMNINFLVLFLFLN